MRTSAGAIVNAIRPIARRAVGGVLEADRFFVARSGVLTLAFRGFPEGLLRLKRDLEAALRDLPYERPGSTWPKVTLAALEDERPLSQAEVDHLWAATMEANEALKTHPVRLAVRSVDLVITHNRALEEGRRYTGFELADAVDHKLLPEHRAYVESVLDQWCPDPDAGYRERLAQPGFRASHYRETHTEMTLVFPVSRPLRCIEVFERAVRSRLPDRYTWFRTDARHVTVRTLGAPYPA